MSKKMMYLNARIVGCGERTLVLAHGYGGSQAIWDKVLPHLTQTNKVLLFDWDFSGGGGGADDDDAAEDEEQRYTFARYGDELVALMDEMDVSGAVYVGHSMSGMVGCIASVKRPDLFTHLVLVGASPRYINSEDYEGGFEQPDIDKMMAIISSDFHSWAEGFVPLIVGAAAVEPLVARSFFAMDPRVAHALANMIFLGDQREVLDCVAVPCTLVHASHDFAAPPCVGRYMQRRIAAAAAMVTIDSVGHFPQLVAPDELLRTLDLVLGVGSNGGSGSGDDEEEAEAEAAAANEGSCLADVEVKGQQRGISHAVAKQGLTRRWLPGWSESARRLVPLAWRHISAAARELPRWPVTYNRVPDSPLSSEGGGSPHGSCPDLPPTSHPGPSPLPVAPVPPLRAAAAIEDRLSRLPDTLLSNSVSRLSVKDAVRTTTVLSTSWRRLWASTPLVLDDTDLLDIRDEDLQRGHSNSVDWLAIASGVHQALLSHPGPYLCVHLTCCGMTYFSSLLPIWLRRLAANGVQDLVFVNRPLPFDLQLPADVLLISLRYSYGNTYGTRFAVLVIHSISSLRHLYLGF
ncbi:hypothetical protein GUJ93_ZPchr0001g32432 [Zizania palustris]|uniref:AB hydrolase-1 domain-containing protein n=1 Tax=Zizania palustris TaxID=103762 RepID=A0A8J5VNK3_ZIZPA|nr:hypothetical protein GUJ93_ZPchr0001g32432 [Zizania palustris]